MQALAAEMQAALDDLAERLGDPATWEYDAEGGPLEADDPELAEGDLPQNDVSDQIKQVRFLYHYVLSDGSLGTHSPVYVRAMLEKADQILTGIGR